MTPKILVMIGPSNSGKSSWAFEFIQNNPGWVRVNRDTLRHMLEFKSHLDNTGENLVTEILNHAAEVALISGYNVLLDNMHCKLENIKDICIRYGDIADIEFKVMDELPLEVLKERALGRSKVDGFPPVPDHILGRALKNFKKLKTQFDFMPIKKKDT